MAILLARHGETPLNASRVVQPPETPLSERGRRQAARLARRLRGEPVLRILASDLPRAVMTAEAVRRTTGAPLTLDPRLQERNFGALRGTPYAELPRPLLDPDLEPPGGESWGAFHARVAAAWEWIRGEADASGDLVVVTHGLFCHALLERHLPPVAGAGPAAFANTSLTRIAGPPRFRVEVLACIAHLDAEDLAPEARTAGGRPPDGGDPGR